jgi:hypothetical protein
MIFDNIVPLIMEFTGRDEDKIGFIGLQMGSLRFLAVASRFKLGLGVEPGEKEGAGQRLGKDQVRGG